MALAASPLPLGVAQERGRSASPDELWQDYPLRPDEEAGDAGAPTDGTPGATEPDRAAPAAGGSGDASSKPSSSGSDETVSGTVIIVLLVLLVVPLVALFALLAPWRRLRRPRPRGTSSDRQVAGASPTAPPPSPTWTDLRNSTWTAEIQWRSGARASRFCVVASPPGAEKEVTLAESPRVEWPPSSDAALESLVSAVEDLQRSAVAAGWEPTEPGASWFARRFAWPRTDRGPQPTLERAPTPAAERA